MVHPASGFRGTRAGVTAGSGSSLQSNDSSSQPLPRIRVSYWCAKGHETQPVFLKLPDDQIPLVWDCRRCGGPASRDGQAAALAELLFEFAGPVNASVRSARAGRRTLAEPRAK